MTNATQTNGSATRNATQLATLAEPSRMLAATAVTLATAVLAGAQQQAIVPAPWPATSTAVAEAPVVNTVTVQAPCLTTPVVPAPPLGTTVKLW